MLHAASGANTYKGAIFTVGTLCAALGPCPESAGVRRRMFSPRQPPMTRGLVERELTGLTEDNAQTAGQRLYLRHEITGVRGQLEAGLPAVREAGLPTLECGLSLGKFLNDAGCAALLAVMAAADDTNLIACGGLDQQREIKENISRLLRQEPYPSPRTLEQLDAQFIEKNLYPGGSADLLAACYLLHFLRTEAS